MSYVNAKEGTGVRARGDLSPNMRALSDETSPLTPQQLELASQWLNGLIRQAEGRHATHVFIPVRGAKRLVDALLAAAHPQSAPTGVDP